MSSLLLCVCLLTPRSNGHLMSRWRSTNVLQCYKEKTPICWFMPCPNIAQYLPPQPTLSCPRRSRRGCVFFVIAEYLTVAITWIKWLCHMYPRGQGTPVEPVEQHIRSDTTKHGANPPNGLSYMCCPAHAKKGMHIAFTHTHTLTDWQILWTQHVPCVHVNIKSDSSR